MAAPLVFPQGDDVHVHVPLGNVGGRRAPKRWIVISRETIEDYLGLPPESAGRMDARQRESFVRNRLDQILVIAERRAAAGEPGPIMIRVSDL